MMESLVQRMEAIAEMVKYGMSRGAQQPVDKSPRSPVMDMSPDTDDFRDEVQISKQALELTTSEFNVAVVGARFSGKSTLITGILHKPDAEPKPCDGNRKKYTQSPQSIPLSLWELPGAGVGHPALTYYYDKKLYAYDLILLVCDRFGRVDFEILRGSLRFRSRLIIVRSKADEAVDKILKGNLQSDSATTEPSRNHNELRSAMKTLRDKVMATIKHGVGLAGIDQGDVFTGPNAKTVYIVSGRGFIDPHIYQRLMKQNNAARDVNEGEEEELIMDEDNLYNAVIKHARIFNARRMRTQVLR